MKQQTAVEWLYDRFLFAGYAIPTQWKEQAKTIEKEQIKESFEIGFNEGCSFMYDNGNDLKNGEQYYNQTYNQNK